MRQSSVKVLDGNDREFVEILRELGIPRNVASMVTYLSNVDEATSREIEIGSGLRQPEVSIAMRTLRPNRWVEERELKREGKGRPLKIYKLATPLDEIIGHFEEAKEIEASEVGENIKKLRALTGKLSST